MPAPIPPRPAPALPGPPLPGPLPLPAPPASALLVTVPVTDWSLAGKDAIESLPCSGWGCCWLPAAEGSMENSEAAEVFED